MKKALVKVIACSGGFAGEAPPPTCPVVGRPAGLQMPTVTWICQRCCCGVCFQLSPCSHQAAFLFHLKALTFPLMCLWKRRAMVPGRGGHNVGTTSALAPGAEDVLGGCGETPSFPPSIGSFSVPCQEQELPLLLGSVPWMVALLDFCSKGARAQWGVTSPCAVPEVGEPIPLLLRQDNSA